MQPVRFSREGSHQKSLGLRKETVSLPFPWQMALLGESRRNLLTLSFLITACVAVGGYAYALSDEASHFGKVLSVRKVLNNPTYLVGRYTPTHYYSLFIAVSISNQTSCAEYTTPVLDEIDHLMSAVGMDVETAIKKKRLTLRTPNSQRIKARLVEEHRCLLPLPAAK
jgi:hypothetical protein